MKVLCKNDYKNLGVIFKSGKFYQADFEYNLIITVMNERNYRMVFSRRNSHQERKKPSLDVFEDYFYSDSEIRKLKLDKLSQYESTL